VLKAEVSRERVGAITGLTALCSSAASAVSVIAALFTLINGELAGARVFTTMAGLSLGLLLNAVFLGTRLEGPPGC
jgi:hypothetical protein